MTRWARVFAATVSALAISPQLRAEDPTPTPAGSVRPHDAQRIRERLERLRERAAALASAAPSATGSGPAPVPSALEKASTAELAQRWAALAELRRARREKRRAELRDEVGRRLAEPSVAAELQLHERRLAELGRIEFLAQNARQGAERTQLLSRVARLTARETERHRRRLATLALRAASSASAPPVPRGEAPH